MASTGAVSSTVADRWCARYTAAQTSSENAREGGDEPACWIRPFDQAADGDHGSSLRETVRGSPGIEASRLHRSDVLSSTQFYDAQSHAGRVPVIFSQGRPAMARGGRGFSA
jgi:hypothetical protein